MELRDAYKDVRHYPTNMIGRDFVVGDLHGCIDMLTEAMEYLQFNKATDRMFSVGDLIDRGPKSFETAELIYQPWFHCVRANHEQMMIDGVVNKNNHWRRNWYANGGAWGKDYSEWQLEDLARNLDRLPYIITVGEGDGRFNIVHAEIVVNGYNTERGTHFRAQVTDEYIDNWQLSDQDKENLIWGRMLISNAVPDYPPPDDELYHHPTQMSPTFVGHTPIREPVRVQNQYYLDGGAVFAYRQPDSETNTLMIAEPAAATLYKYVLMNKTVYKIPFSEIQRLS